MADWGEAELFALYERLEKPLYNVLYRTLWDSEEAHDLVQESFVKLWAMRARIREETVEPLAYRIGLNLARSLQRKRRVRRWISLGALPVEPRAPADVEGEALDDERWRRVVAAIDALPRELRDALLLSAFSGLGYRAIGEALGVPEGTVGSRRNRALKLLRAELGEVDEPLA